MPFPGRHLLALALAVLLTPQLAAQDGHTQAVRTEDDALASRLEALVDALELKREQLHIPGMALAVVQDGEIVLAKGFGVSDVEQGTPVTPETIFAIGSSTKAFTTALISMLVDEGAMSWDAPITDYLPGFKLDIQTYDKGAQVTLRDLTCHRTGFTRMGVLWAGGRATREEVLDVATHAEPLVGFREKFFYNNVMFLAAGVASARAADTDWDSLLRERLLEPLGMSSSNTSVTAAQDDPRLSLGYRWDDDAGEYEHLPMRVLDIIGPAGAINSNVLDMAQWLRLQLADGVFEGQRLLSQAQIDETRTPQIFIGGSKSYGLGWMLDQWQGRSVVEHGGNIDGFAAAVALMPEENLGLVLLTNVTSTPLQATVVPMVWEAVLSAGEQGLATNGREQDTGDQGTATTASQPPAAVDYDEFVGDFMANFGPFDGDVFAVQVNSAGKLAVDVPGQTLYELKQPDEEGLWYFAMTDSIAVSFWRDAQGAVQSLKMHQGGAIYESPRRGYEYPLEFELEDVQPLLGHYDDPALDAEVKVLVHNNRLCVDVPGQMIFEMHNPDDEGVWWFRAVPELGLQFHQEDDEPAIAFTFLERGGRRVCTRVEGARAELPSQDDVRALCALDARREILASLGAMRLRGSVRMVQSGVTGDVTWTANGPEHYLLKTDLGRFVQVEEAYADGTGTVWSDSGPFQNLSGKTLRQSRQNHPAFPYADWSRYGDSFRVEGREELDGRDVLRIGLVAGDLPAMKLFIDAETGDLLKHSGTRIVEALGFQMPYSVRYEDYRELHGLRIPHRTVSSDDWTGHVIVLIESVEVGVDVEPGMFVLEEH